MQNNCPFLHTLDLSESLLDNECCNILAEMANLNILHLNHCAKLESAGVTNLLLKLKSLTRIDALRGKSSNVQKTALTKQKNIFIPSGYNDLRCRRSI